MKHSQHRWIVEVLEENVASVEVDGQHVTSIPRWVLPIGAREGDVLTVSHQREHGRSLLEIAIDEKEKRRLRDYAAQQVLAHEPDDRGGDITL